MMRAASLTVSETQDCPPSGRYCLQVPTGFLCSFPFPPCRFSFMSINVHQKSWEQRKLAAGHPQPPDLCSKPPPLKGDLLTPGSHGADSESVSHLYLDGVENESWYHRHQQPSCAHQKDLGTIPAVEEQLLSFSGCTITEEKSQGQTLPVLESVDQCCCHKGKMGLRIPPRNLHISMRMSSC